MEIDTAQAQKVMLEILRVFDTICKEHHLTYWLDHGTLLGAVRDGGFIPWDDDLDVTMPREDYEKFLKIAPSLLPESLFLQTKEKDPHYRMFFAKIRKRNSRMVDHWEQNRDIKYHQGIFIDIFPVNTILNRPFQIQRYKFMLNFAKIFVNRFWVWRQPAKMMIRLINRMHTKEGDFIVSGGESMHYVIHVPKKSIFPLRKIMFEGRSFPVPNDTDTYLSSIFGVEYMQPPPPERRKQHSCKIELFEETV